MLDQQTSVLEVRIMCLVRSHIENKDNEGLSSSLSYSASVPHMYRVVFSTGCGLYYVVRTMSLVSGSSYCPFLCTCPSLIETRLPS